MATPRLLPALACAVAIAIGMAQPGSAQDAPRTGTFTTNFDQRSPYSTRERMAEVAHWDARQLEDWDIETIEFQMVVPEQYTGEEPYGLLVFIHPYDDVDATNPRAFFFGRVIQDVLAEHKLIWVSYDDAGNPVMPNKRMGLALDAVHNVTRQYNIDEERVYVSGMSGGGRLTCMTAVYYPQVFTGAVPIVGSLYFREVPVPEDPELRALIRPEPGEHAVWPQRLIRPDRRELERMAATQRWVLLTGSEDFNMPEMRMHFEHGFERDHFAHAHYLEVPGLGHAFPDADWFERAIVLLDAPLQEDAAGERAAPLDPQQQRAEDAAQRRLDAAERLIDRAPDRALRLLRRVDELYPDTRAAERARELIADIESDNTPGENGGGGGNDTGEPQEVPEDGFIIE